MSGSAKVSIGVLGRTLSVLVPVLNEERNIRPTVQRLIEALSITIEEYEIIIVNDGSSDETGRIADELAVEFESVKAIHNQKNMGLGYSYVRGVQAATKAFFVYIPGDNTWPYRSFVELFGNLGRADIITSFAINPGVRPQSRRIVSKMYTQTLNMIFGYKLNYFNGLTIYPIEFLQLNPTTTIGFGFQAEALLKALDLGLSYIEVGLSIDERTAGGSKAVNLRNIISVFMTILRLIWELRVVGRWRNRNSAPLSQLVISNPSTSVDELGFEPAEDTSIYADDENNDQSSKVVVISGSSSGIGLALAQDFANTGNQVFACSRNHDRLINAFADYQNVQVFPCDVSDEVAVAKFADFVRTRTKRVDVLINCAGGFGAIGRIDQVSSGDWIQTLNENLFGTFLMIKYFLPSLDNSEAPQILNFSGGGAFSPFPNFSAYACSKAGIVRLTETLAVELQPRGICVNAIAPGIILTEAHKAVIAAGAEKAGSMNFQRTQRLLKHGGARMDTLIQCVRALLSKPYQGLTGKTISVNFDPWSSSAFRKHIVDICRSELYTMRRINLVNLPEGRLRTNLFKVWASFGTKR